MASELQVRQGTGEDLASIVQLSEAVFGAEAHSVFIWRQVLDLTAPLTLIGSEAGVDVGYAIISPTWQSSHAWFLTLGVTPELRGQGIGRRLALEAVKKAQTLGVTTISLTVDANNEPAVRLYESLGFEHKRRLEGYFGPGKDRLVLTLNTTQTST